MDNAFIAVSDKTLTAPLAGARLLRGLPNHQNSFELSNRNNLVGTLTDVGEGLEQVPWEGDASELAIVNGELVRSPNASSAAWSNGVKIPENIRGYMVEVEITRTITAGASFAIDMFRSWPHGEGGPNSYRLTFYESGNVRMMKRFGGQLAYFTGSFATPPGTIVGIRWMGGLLSLLIDGVEIESHQDSTIEPGGYYAVSGVSAIANLGIGSINTRVL